MRFYIVIIALLIALTHAAQITRVPIDVNLNNFFADKNGNPLSLKCPKGPYDGSDNNKLYEMYIICKLGLRTVMFGILYKPTQASLQPKFTLHIDGRAVQLTPPKYTYWKPYKGYNGVLFADYSFPRKVADGIYTTDTQRLLRFECYQMLDLRNQKRREFVGVIARVV